jgi:hypothetical protein
MHNLRLINYVRNQLGKLENVTREIKHCKVESTKIAEIMIFISFADEWHVSCRHFASETSNPR